MSFSKVNMNVMKRELEDTKKGKIKLLEIKKYILIKTPMERLRYIIYFRRKIGKLDDIVIKAI